jgi:hypothetical protein
MNLVFPGTMYRGNTMNRKVYMYEKDMLKLHEDQLKLSQANYDLLKIMIDQNTRQIKTISNVLIMILGILFIYFIAQLIVGVQ